MLSVFRFLFTKPIYCFRLLYHYIGQCVRKEAKCSEIQLSDSLLAYTDGKFVHLTCTASAQTNDILSLSAHSSTGCKNRMWCNALRSALNDTVYCFNPNTLGVDYVKIYHKTGIKLFITKDKDIPIQILSR